MRTALLFAACLAIGCTQDNPNSAVADGAADGHHLGELPPDLGHAPEDFDVFFHPDPDMRRVDLSMPPPDLAPMCVPTGGDCSGTSSNICCTGICDFFSASPAPYKCVACGRPGLPCCAKLATAIPASGGCSANTPPGQPQQNAICDVNGMCTACGKPGQECCGPNNRCDSASDTCSACSPTSSRGDTRCHAAACGTLGQPCCVTWGQFCSVGGVCLASNGTCKNGTCQ